MRICGRLRGLFVTLLPTIKEIRKNGVCWHVVAKKTKKNREPLKVHFLSIRSIGMETSSV